MNKRTILLFASFVLCVPLSAQTWSGILDTSRAIDWTQAGVIGGVPSATWTQCGATINPYGPAVLPSGDNGSGTVNTTTGSTAVNWVSGSAFQTRWVGFDIIIFTPTGGRSRFLIDAVVPGTTGATLTLHTPVAAGGSGVTFRGAGGLDPSTIQSAINACGANQYVLLGPGTFNLDGSFIAKSNMVLRGSGSNSTFLVPVLPVFGCGSIPSWYCVGNDQTIYGYAPISPSGGSQTATWSGGYSQNATSITVSGVGSSGIINGQYIYLDQVDDLAVGSGGSLFVCERNNIPCSLEGAAGAGRNIPAGNYRNQIQVVKVTAGCASTCTGAGPFTLTITPGLYGIRWTAADNPGVWWPLTIVTNAGVENLSVDTSNLDPTNVTGTAGVAFANSTNSWVKGIRSLNGNLAHVWFGIASHITVQDNYFYGTKDAASQSYGVETFGASDNLVVNNIFQRISNPVILSPVMGNVYAYNFSINDFINTPTFGSSQNNQHNAGVLYNLFEGNIGFGFDADLFHGTSGVNTFFRNRWNGNECTSGACNTGGNWPIQLRSYAWDENIIGNILGMVGVHTSYQDNVGGKVIYFIGAGGTEGSVTIPADTQVAASVMRWGNCDTVSSPSCRFVSSEVPTGLLKYANAVPASHTLPASFYYNSQPAFLAGKPWPLIGPDVSGGNIGRCVGGTYDKNMATASGQCVGGTFATPDFDTGHANSSPAMDCYLSTMQGPPDGSGASLSFNSGTCYGGGSGAAATPTFNPGAGTYPTAQTVTISTTTTGAIICWNTTGSPATNGFGTACNNGTLINASSGNITVSVTETVYAVAGTFTLSDSSVGRAGYTISTASPSAPCAICLMAGRTK